MGDKKTNAQLDGLYMRLETMCDASYSAFLECVKRLGAANIYRITCGKAVFWDVKSMMQLRWNSESPFTPVVNLVMDGLLEPQEWYITALHLNGDAIGSVGTEGIP